MKNWGAQTLTGSLEIAARQFPRNEALVFKDSRVTYAEMVNQVNTLAKGLISLGIKQGEQVGIWAPNRPEWIYAMYALAKIGARSVMINTRFKKHDIAYVLEQSDCVALLLPDQAINIGFLDLLAELSPELGDYPLGGQLKAQRFPKLRSVICLGKKKYEGVISYSELMAKAEFICDSKLEERHSLVQPEDVMNLVYTSGTTSFPKVVMLTHDQNVKKGMLLSFFSEYTENDRLLLTVPLFAVFGYLTGAIPILMRGGCLILQEAFEPEEEMRLIEKERCTAHLNVPMMVYSMVEHPAFGKYDLRSLRKGRWGFPLNIQMASFLKETFKSDSFIGGYGLTESTGPVALINGKELLEVGYTTCGKPLKEVKIKILDPTTNEEVPLGSVGEVMVKSFFVMRGYYNQPADTAKTIDPNGWLHTGDLGMIDERGYLILQGRCKDIYKTSGFNVACAEVEEFLMQHPKVKEVAVVGVPDKYRDEVGMAFISLKPHVQCSEEEIFKFCKGNIANYKIPRYINFRKEFPRSATEKIQKFKLQEEAVKKFKLNI